MKTKKISKQRTQARDFDVAMLDCQGEFDGLLDDSFLDEEGLSLIEDDDE